MDSNKTAAKGYSTQALGENNFVFTSPERKSKPSFNINEITEIENSEILKINLGSGLLCRIMKYTNNDEAQTPMLTFDLVNMEEKSITFKSPKGFPNGVGLAGFLLDYNQITQWEIPPMELLCRAFIFGIQTDFKSVIEEFNIKVSQQADWFIKNKLD